MADYPLYPDGTDSSTSINVSSGTIHAALDDPANAPSEAEYAISASSVGDGQFLLTMQDLPSLPGSLIINDFSVCTHARGDAVATGKSSRVWRNRIKIGAVDYYGSNNTTEEEDGAATFVSTWALNPATGLRWTVSDIASLKIGVDEENTYGGGVTRVAIYYIQHYGRVNFDPVGGGLELARDVASRRLLVHRLGRFMLQVRAPMEFLDPEILSLIVVSHESMIDASGERLGLQRWARRPFRLLKSKVDLNNFTVTMWLRDLREGIGLRTFWDAARTTQATSYYSQGVPRLMNGGTRTFSRNCVANVEDSGSAAAGARRVVQLTTHVEALDAKGLRIFPAATNLILNSAFAEQLTGWTTASSGGGSVSAVSGVGLFDTEITDYACRLLTAASVGNASTVWQTITANSTTNWILSIEHKETASSSDKPRYRVKRLSDNLYWRNTTQTFAAYDATLSENLMDVSLTYVRYESNPIPMTNGVQYLIEIERKTTGSALATYVAHVQLETGKHPTGWIVTPSTGALSTVADNLLITQPSLAKFIYPVSSGTLFFDVETAWTPSTSAGHHVAFHVYYDASNEAMIWWDNGNARWSFHRMAGGVSTEATKTHSPVPGTRYRIAVRWTGAEGELGLAPYTQDIFVDGVKGTSITAAAAPTPTASSTVYIGQTSSGTSLLAGYLSNMIMTPLVLTDEEIAAQ
jgi:hypothetical protein